MNETPITVVGRLTADAVLRTTNSGVAMGTFRIATNARKKNPTTGEYEDGQTSYYNVRAYRGLGANLAASLKKGQAVLVSGSLEITEYDRPDGSKSINGDILASAVGHDLTWGITTLIKVARGSSSEAVAADPHVRAAAQAMAAAAASEQDPETVPYLTVDEEGRSVDPLTGEVREAAA